jgi:uncharacterized protein YbjT (DUF2867 family)
MRVVLFGASGMIGQGVLRACLADPEIDRIASVVRAPTGVSHSKLVELVHQDFTDFSALAGELSGYDTCLFCLGVSSAGMTEAAYRHITYDITLAAAQVLAIESPNKMSFLYISGAGADTSEHKRTMWARVKGATENALLKLPFKGAYMVRPAYIQPRHGIKSRTKWTRVLYAVVGPLYPLWRLLFRPWVTNTDELSAAMLHVAKRGAKTPIIENRDLRALAAPPIAAS